MNNLKNRQKNPFFYHIFVNGNKLAKLSKPYDSNYTAQHTPPNKTYKKNLPSSKINNT